MNYLKTVFTLLLAFSMFLGYAQQTRSDIELNDNWIFKSKEISGDSVHKTVVLPHTWNIYDALNGLDYYRGKGIYTKTVSIDKAQKGKRFFLKFEGVQSVADVFWNGKHLGQHRGGYSAFIFEITSLVDFETGNKLLVEADNTHFDDILPLGGDFNIYGGIYRPVHLLVTDQIGISPLDYASSGVYLTQQNVSEVHAQINAATIISNGSPSPKAITVIVKVFDEKGVQITSVQKEESLNPGESKTITQAFSILKPHLWNSRKDPFLYRCNVQTIVDGRITDEVNQPLGLRYYKVDSNKGFFLNGEHLPLHGVSRHQDKAECATALSNADHKTDMELIKEIGANSIRLSHYQHAEYFYSLCDSAGMVVWSEIPFVGSLMGGYTNSKDFRINAKQQLTELIRQNYNHPSVCFWGIFNELSTPKDNSPVDFVTSLNDLAKKEDPSRITTAASFSGDDNKINFITSLIAWNKYFGWYNGKAEMLGSWIDQVHSKYPELKIGISEYGAGGNPFQHAEKIKRSFPFFHYWHPEEYQSEYHEKNWNEIVQRPFIWGTYIWNMFDFGVAFRDEGDMTARNNKGMVTFDRKVKKDVFYFYKANWNPEPMIYIANKRFLHREDKITHVKVYSNAEKVELFVNGISHGSQSGKNAVFLWEKVSLQKGNNSIKAIAEINANKITDSCNWDYKNYTGVYFLIWFLRVGIIPFVTLCIIAIIALYYLGFKRLNKGWVRKAVRIKFFFLVFLLLVILILFVYGKMNYVNIFDYSVL